MSGGARILVVEDEAAIADAVTYALRTEGFAAVWCATGREGLEVFDQAAAGGGGEAGFALVILDVGLPDGSGFDVCRELRTRTAVPVLFLTARSGEIDRVVGLELGGDDYVTKPFSPREVTARVRAILRRTQAGGARAASAESAGSGGSAEDKRGGAGGAGAGGEGGDCHVLRDNGISGRGGLAVDAEAKMASLDGVRLELTRYEFRLLAVLHSRPGRVWSRDELMMRAWEDPGASLDRTVDAHIKTLRGKFRAVAAGTEWIVTHRGEGYSLRARS